MVCGPDKRPGSPSPFTSENQTKRRRDVNIDTDTLCQDFCTQTTTDMENVEDLSYLETDINNLEKSVQRVMNKGLLSITCINMS